MLALINKHWRPVSRDEFWHHMGDEETALALAFVPTDQRDSVFEREHKAFEVY